MKYAKCISTTPGSLLIACKVYEIAETTYTFDNSDRELIEVKVNGEWSGPWYKDRFIEVSFNKYLNLLK